jgi:hypothetical protein
MVIKPKFTDPMTSVMPYQYPIPSGPNADIPPNLVNDYHLPALAPPAHPQTLHQSTVTPIRGDTPLASKLGKMRRASSTSNVQGQARADAKETALSAEKRRNKLGYHRTSVACGQLISSHNSRAVAG